MPRRFSLRFALAALLALAAACGKDGGTNPSTDDPDDGLPDNDAPNLPGPPPPPTAHLGTIAYTRDGELRLIEPDGSGDRLVWRAPAVPDRPDLSYEVTGPAWRPDGGEIAFSSNHESAVSPFAADLYAVRQDGGNLRKLTNGPTHDWLDDFPSGTVTVTVSVGGFQGPWFVYVQGAPEPAMITGGARLTFTGVADLGSGIQAVTATNGAGRWTGTAVDVRAGRTVDAGTLNVSGFGTPESDYRAVGPFWRSDGSRVGFVGPVCLLESVPVDPPPGFAFTPLIAPEASSGLCIAEWGSTPSTANQILAATVGFDDEGRTFVYRIPEGSGSLPQPLLSFDRYQRITDLHWLADGSGFVLAKQDDLIDIDVNIWEYTFATGTLRQLTNLTSASGVFARRFTISPDGQRIVFEVTDDLLYGASDLWIVNRDGSGLQLLVSDAGFPAWNPRR